MVRSYAVFAVFAVLFLGVAHWRGWSLTSVEEVKNVPRSVRDNPGTYRSHYFFGGK